MNKRFYSKKDLWIGLVIWISILSSILPLIFGKMERPGPITITTIISILVVLFVAWIWFGTYYEFMDEYLLVRCGPMKERY